MVTPTWPEYQRPTTEEFRAWFFLNSPSEQLRILSEMFSIMDEARRCFQHDHQYIIELYLHQRLSLRIELERSLGKTHLQEEVVRVRRELGLPDA